MTFPSFLLLDLQSKLRPTAKTKHPILFPEFTEMLTKSAMESSLVVVMQTQ